MRIISEETRSESDIMQSLVELALLAGYQPESIKEYFGDE